MSVRNRSLVTKLFPWPEKAWQSVSALGDREIVGWNAELGSCLPPPHPNPVVSAPHVNLRAVGGLVIQRKQNIEEPYDTAGVRISKIPIIGSNKICQAI